MGLVHRSISFRWLTRDSSVNKSRNQPFVATKNEQPGPSSTQLADGGRARDDGASFL
jgi:hypothetical protein